MDKWVNCKKCQKEIRWAYSGKYRASYCDQCNVTYLEQFHDLKNLWLSLGSELVKY